MTETSPQVRTDQSKASAQVISRIAERKQKPFRKSLRHARVLLQAGQIELLGQWQLSLRVISITYPGVDPRADPVPFRFICSVSTKRLLELLKGHKRSRRSIRPGHYAPGILISSFVQAVP